MTTQAKHTPTRKVSLSGLVRDDVFMLLHSLHIAFEDGNIYGGDEEGSVEFLSKNDRGDVLTNKLRALLAKVSP